MFLLLLFTFKSVYNKVLNES